MSSNAYGSSRWMTITDAMRAGLFEKRGLLVGDFTGILPVYYRGTNAITYGSAGSGKGTTVIIPDLLHNRFIFLNDPGGENTAVAMKQWRLRGFETYVINPFGMHRDAPWELPSHAFNPFDFLDPASETFSADAKVFAEMMTIRTGREQGSNKYFNDRAEAWIHADAVFINVDLPDEQRHPGTLYDHVHLDHAGWTALLKRMKASKAGDGLVRSVAIDMERMQEQAPEEFSAVLSTVQQNLQWLAEPKARACVSRSEVDFSALKGLRGQKGAVIAVILPLPYKETHRAISRLAIQCAVWEMQRMPAARDLVLFEIDEAASLGRIERLPQWLAELRKYRVQWSLHFQNVAQPKHLYETEWQTFQGNAGLKRFVGVSDIETAKEVSAYLGVGTISIVSSNSGGTSTVSQTARELKKPDEVFRLAKDEMIALIENLKPAILRKTAYWDRPEFAGRYYRNPYFEYGIRAGFGQSLAVLNGNIAYFFAWWFAPHPVAGAIELAALVAGGAYWYFAGG